MQDEESDDSEDGYVYKTVHYYDESPDGYAEDLCDEDDDYEYQERSETSLQRLSRRTYSL